MCLGEGATQEPEARTLLIEDTWFGSIWVAAAASSKNVEATYYIKSNHRLCLKQFIKDTLKDAPGRTSIVLED